MRYYSVNLTLREDGGVDYWISRYSNYDDTKFEAGISSMIYVRNSKEYTVEVEADSPEEALERAVLDHTPVWANLEVGVGETINRPSSGGSGPAVA